MPFKKITALFITIISFLLPAFTAKAQITRLKAQLETIISTHNATVGICIKGPGIGDTLRVNGSSFFPMQSVYKFPIALAVLNEVDKGRLSLSQKIWVPKADLRPDTWSPMREKYPNGDVSVPLTELLRFTVSQSDNNGCDILLKLLGGTAKANQYIHNLGISDVHIAATEAEMAKAWEVQYTNKATPAAMVQLMQLFYDGKVLTAKSRALLLKMMTETTTGTKRLKGQLPAGTMVAHKTGTSNTNGAGITAATNDIGFITLPNGKLLTIAVFVMDSHEGVAMNEQIIAAIAKTAWDYFSGL